MAKRIFEMTSEELINFLNQEGNFYAEMVLDKQQIPGDKYFNEARYTDEALFDLFFGCDVMFNTTAGEKHQDKLNEYVLQMFEPIQVEFYARTGRPNPQDAVTVIKL